MTICFEQKDCLTNLTAPLLLIGWKVFGVEIVLKAGLSNIVTHKDNNYLEMDLQ